MRRPVRKPFEKHKYSYLRRQLFSYVRVPFAPTVEMRPLVFSLFSFSNLVRIFTACPLNLDAGISRQEWACWCGLSFMIADVAKENRNGGIEDNKPCFALKMVVNVDFLSIQNTNDDYDQVRRLRDREVDGAVLTLFAEAMFQ